LKPKVNDPDVLPFMPVSLDRAAMDGIGGGAPVGPARFTRDIGAETVQKGVRASIDKSLCRPGSTA
jgi:hypothetical protein